MPALVSLQDSLSRLPPASLVQALAVELCAGLVRRLYCASNDMNGSLLHLGDSCDLQEV